jgi:hypothetical protein
MMYGNVAVTVTVTRLVLILLSLLLLLLLHPKTVDADKNVDNGDVDNGGCDAAKAE